MSSATSHPVPDPVPAPEQGQLVTVRNRLWLVQDVIPHEDDHGRTVTRVDLECLDDDRTDPIHGPGRTIRNRFTRNPGWRSRADILAGTGLPQKVWNQAILALLASGAVARTGQKRGTKYRFQESPSQQPQDREGGKP